MIKLKSFPDKDPSGKLEYLFDWASKSNNNGNTDWLKPNETILSHEVIVPGGITKISSDVINSGTSVIVWLSGGTLGTSYEVSCKIVTSDTREDTRRATILIKNR